MRVRNILLPLLFLSCLTARPAAAEYYDADALASYVGIDGMNWNYEQSASGSTTSVAAAGYRVRVGQQVEPMMAMELQFGSMGSQGSAELERMYGVFVRGNLPMNRMNLYIQAGVGSVQLTDSANNDVSEVGVAYGVGAEISLYKDVFLNVDYTTYVNDSERNFNAVSVGIGYRF